MEIGFSVSVPADDLVVDVGSVTAADVVAAAREIREIGFEQPVVVCQGRVVAGAALVLACQALGGLAVPVMSVDPVST